MSVYNVLSSVPVFIFIFVCLFFKQQFLCNIELCLQCAKIDFVSFDVVSETHIVKSYWITTTYLNYLKT